jgi:hypothetical protein
MIIDETHAKAGNEPCRIWMAIMDLEPQFFPGEQIPEERNMFVMAGHTLCLELFVSVADTSLQRIAY